MKARGGKASGMIITEARGEAETGTAHGVAEAEYEVDKTTRLAAGCWESSKLVCDRHSDSSKSTKSSSISIKRGAERSRLDEEGQLVSVQKEGEDVRCNACFSPRAARSAAKLG
jgi:hypothetical protein